MSYLEVIKPTVTLLQESGLGVAEFAARTAYDSFELSEHDSIIKINDLANGEYPILKSDLEDIHKIDSSDILYKLAWVYHHHSVLELINFSFLIKNTSRGVLQEHARHRLQSLTVRSTRYTLSNIIYAYIASQFTNKDIILETFLDLVKPLNILVTTDEHYNNIEYASIFNKLSYHFETLKLDEILGKDNLNYLDNINNDTPEIVFNTLLKNKSKKNMGDKLKHIVTDNFSVDLVCNFNLRSLRNYIMLRDSGAAYYQMRYLAEAILKTLPEKYVRLIKK